MYDDKQERSEDTIKLKEIIKKAKEIKDGDNMDLLDICVLQNFVEEITKLKE